MQDNTIEELDNLSSLYKLLSRVFIREIDKELLSLFRTESFYNVLKSSGIDLGDEFLNQDEASLLESLAVEYARLFLTGYNVSLYSSVYLDPNNLLCGKSTKEVSCFYQRCGLEIVNKTLLPDHIGLELDLMSYLKKKEASALKNNESPLKWIELQKEFISQHLSQWALKFFSSVEAEAQHPFYHQMAKLGYQFIEEEVNNKSERFF